MKAYVVVFRGDCTDEVSAVFLDREKAEAYLIESASEDMDCCDIANENRKCEYRNGNLTEIYDESYYCYWRIEEHTIKED
jgi:hypothetical protein